MARLEGERKSPVPVLIGIVLLALVAIGGYYAYQNRGADAISMAPGEVNVLDNRPGNMASNGDVDANREGNTVTIGSDTGNNGEEANKATSPNEASGGEASTSASGGTGEEAAGASSAPTSNATTAGTSAATTDEKVGKGVIAERSKTIKNDKAKTTVTYQKKIHQDGSVSHSKTTGAPVATPAAQ